MTLFILVLALAISGAGSTIAAEPTARANDAALLTDSSTGIPSEESPRVRVLAGAVSLSGELFPWPSISWRFSPPSPAYLGRVWSGGFSGEFGVVYLFPYAIIGPEVRYRNSYATAGFGIFLLALPGLSLSLYAALPAVSISVGTLHRITPFLSIEVEAGAYALPYSPVNIPFIQLGISW